MNHRPLNWADCWRDDIDNNGGRGLLTWAVAIGVGSALLVAANWLFGWGMF